MRRNDRRTLMFRTAGAGLDQALALTGDGAFVSDAAGRVVLWNPAAQGIMGYTPPEVAGRRCCDIFAGRNGDGEPLCAPGCHALRRVERSERVKDFDLHTRTKTGKPIWLNVSVLSIESGGPAGPLAVHLFRDVTASRELLKLVHEGPAAATEGEPAAMLTKREVEVLRLMTLGVNTTAVAKHLRVSPSTIRNHVQNIFGKLGVHSRLEAVAYAHTHRMF